MGIELSLKRPARKDGTKSNGKPARPRRYHARRTTSERLQEALMILAEGKASPISHKEKSWASITFTGSRHQVMLDFDGAEAVAAGERFIAALPDHEFQIVGQLVADASVDSVDHRLSPNPRMVVEVTLLLLEEG